MLNATLQCSTSLDTLFNICCTAAVTFVARHMLSRVNSLDAPQFNHKTKSKQRNKTAGEPSSSHHIAEWYCIVTTLFPLTLVSGIRTHWMEFSKWVNSVNLTTSHYCRRSPPPPPNQLPLKQGTQRNTRLCFCRSLGLTG